MNRHYRYRCLSGVEQHIKNKEYPVVIAALHIKELGFVRKQDNGLQVGSSVTMTDLKKALLDIIKEVEG